MKKKYNTNSQTEHSRKKRADNATKWNKEQYEEGKKGNISVSGHREDIGALRELIQDIPGNSNREKFWNAAVFYKENHIK